VVPDEIPLRIPLELLILPTAELLLLHVPPEVVLDKVNVEPAHNVDAPAINVGDGLIANSSIE
jgi:hypothetical protein